MTETSPAGAYRFDFSSGDELRSAADSLGLELPWSEDIAALQRPLPYGETVIPNRWVIQPMEGCDSDAEGSPTELTRRRYRRYAEGGAGLIWFEATAVSPEHRGKPNQLCLHPGNVGVFREWVADVREAAKAAHGTEPFLVLQSTYPGRFGDNHDILYHHDVMDAAGHVAADQPVLTDEDLAKLPDTFARAAELAQAAGFDSIDIKCCHRYLLSESLAAFTREGPYGGDYENRTRLLLSVVERVRSAADIDVSIRLNVYDGIPYPYGFGTDEGGAVDLAEPKRLVQQLHQLGVRLINVTASTPYLQPHISRPYDKATRRGYAPPEHPLCGVARLLWLAQEIKQELPQACIVGTGYSWLRQFVPQVAAGVLEQQGADLVGLGRGAFAYPDMPRDAAEAGRVDSRKVCISCSKCSELKARAALTGCVVRDYETYLGPYRELLAD